MRLSEKKIWNWYRYQWRVSPGNDYDTLPIPPPIRLRFFLWSSSRFLMYPHGKLCEVEVQHNCNRYLGILRIWDRYQDYVWAIPSKLPTEGTPKGVQRINSTPYALIENPENKSFIRSSHYGLSWIVLKIVSIKLGSDSSKAFKKAL